MQNDLQRTPRIGQEDWPLTSLQGTCSLEKKHSLLSSIGLQWWDQIDTLFTRIKGRVKIWVLWVYMRLINPYIDKKKITLLWLDILEMNLRYLIYSFLDVQNLSNKLLWFFHSSELNFGSFSSELRNFSFDLANFHLLELTQDMEKSID